MARSLVDTNILVYSRDLNEPVKRAQAIEVIDQLRASGELVLSAQCLRRRGDARDATARSTRRLIASSGPDGLA